MRGNKEFDKKHLEQLVVKYGGDFCQKRTEDNDATIVSSVDTSEFMVSHPGKKPLDVSFCSACRKGADTQGLDRAKT